MKYLLSPRIIFLTLLIMGSSSLTMGQANPQTTDDRPPLQQKGDEKRPNLLRILGLSQAQMMEVRRINQSRRPQMDAAQARLRDANRALDEAIYADIFDQTSFDVRLKDVQAAQADLAQLRFTNEMNIRKLLTPDQLARFRELRRRFAPPPPDQRVPPGSDDKNVLQPLRIP